MTTCWQTLIALADSYCDDCRTRIPARQLVIITPDRHHRLCITCTVDRINPEANLSNALDKFTSPERSA